LRISSKFEDSFQNSTNPFTSNFTNCSCIEHHSWWPPISPCIRFYPYLLERLMIEQYIFTIHEDFLRILNQKGRFLSHTFYLTHFFYLRSFLFSFHLKILFQIPYLHRFPRLISFLASRFRLICSNLNLRHQFFELTFMIFLKVSDLEVFIARWKSNLNQVSLSHIMAIHFFQLKC
jgi:hypothetical protein